MFLETAAITIMLHDAKLPTTESSLIINKELRAWHFKLIDSIMQKGAKIIDMAIV